MPFLLSSYHNTLFLLLFTVASLFSAQSSADYPKISVKEAHELSSSGKVLLIDIRSKEEWDETGVAPQAYTISMHQQGGISAFESELTELLKGDKNKPIALICAGGVRSARIQHHLHKQGFTNVADVTEGMLGGLFTKGWISSELPVKPY